MCVHLNFGASSAIQDGNEETGTKEARRSTSTSCRLYGIGEGTGGQTRPAITSAGRQAASAQARNHRQRRRSTSDSEVGYTEPSFCLAIFIFILLGVLETSLGFWVRYRNERWTRPLKYRHFTEHRRAVEIVFAVLVGMILCGAVKLLFAGAACYEASRVTKKKLNPPPGETATCLGFIFSLLFVLG
jgi:uncharacterized membrane protein YidH (DUF202 family)